MTLLIKALIWRLGGTAFSFTAAYLLTGSASLAASVGAAEFFGKLLMYYAYERLWAWRGERVTEKAVNDIREGMVSTMEVL